MTTEQIAFQKSRELGFGPISFEYSLLKILGYNPEIKVVLVDVESDLEAKDAEGAKE